MKIKHLKIKNLRGIKNLSISFSEDTPTVFIGVNGVGKSAILDCIASALYPYIGAMRDISRAKSFRKDFLNFQDEDIKDGENILTHEIEICVNHCKNISWKLEKHRHKKTASLSKDVSNLFFYLEENHQNLPVPVIVYYPTNREVLDVSLSLSKNLRLVGLNTIDTYDLAISGKKLDFGDFFSWFKDREDLENERRLNEYLEYRDNGLDSIRRAFKIFFSEISSYNSKINVSGFEDLRVRRGAALHMTISKISAIGVVEEIIIDQLSHGEKYLLSMIGDLSRRLVIANPGLDNPLQGTGVVLIDEIELHLHPGWQYEIIPALTRTFPNCQFIVTTHSPIVLSQVKPEGIFCLEKGKDGKVIAYHPDSSYGRDTNRILEDLMGVPERPQMFKDQLRELFRFIDDGNLDKAKELQNQLEEAIGSDEPEFARADVLIRRKEILGR